MYKKNYIILKIGFLFKVLMLKEFVFNLFKIFIVFYVVNSYVDCFIVWFLVNIIFGYINFLKVF